MPQFRRISTIEVYNRWQVRLHQLMQRFVQDTDRIKILTDHKLRHPETRVFGLIEAIYAGTKEVGAKEVAEKLLVEIGQDLVENDDPEGFWRLIRKQLNDVNEWIGGDFEPLPLHSFVRDTGIVCSIPENAYTTLLLMRDFGQEDEVDAFKERTRRFSYFCPEWAKWRLIKDWTIDRPVPRERMMYAGDPSLGTLADIFNNDKNNGEE